VGVGLKLAPSTATMSGGFWCLKRYKEAAAVAAGDGKLMNVI